MGIFFKKRDIIERRFYQLQSILKNSFGNVKRDTQLIHQWLSYFNQKITQQEQENSSQKAMIKSLQSELELVPKKQEIKRMIDESFAYEDLLKRLNSVEQRLSQAAPIATQKMPQTEVLELQKRLEKLEEKKTNIKEKLLKKITKNSKEYIKSVVISMIKKYHKISAMQLKEMVVEEQGLVSKSSFYRILEEIEERDDIGVVKEGKEKHYMAKIPQANHQHNH